MFPITAPRPARKCESVSGSHQSDAIPTGASFQHPATYRRGIAWSGTNLLPRLASSRRQPPSRQPWRATQPPTHSPRHFVNNNIKKPLHNFPLSAIMKQETAKANKGRPRRAATLLGPMQEIGPPTQQETCAASILSNNHGLFKREKWECVFSFRRCRDKLQTLRRFCCLGGPEQSPRGTGIPHPQGPDR